MDICQYGHGHLDKSYLEGLGTGQYRWRIGLAVTALRSHEQCQFLKQHVRNPT